MITTEAAQHGAQELRFIRFINDVEPGLSLGRHRQEPKLAQNINHGTPWKSGRRTLRAS